MYICVSVCMCVYVWGVSTGLSIGDPGVQKRAPDTLEMSYKWLWTIHHGYWEKSSGSLQEQYLYLTAELSLQLK